MGGALHFGATPAACGAAQIHGGPGTDTAYVDEGVDPATIAVETVIPH